MEVRLEKHNGIRISGVPYCPRPQQVDLSRRLELKVLIEPRLSVAVNWLPRTASSSYLIPIRRYLIFYWCFMGPLKYGIVTLKVIHFFTTGSPL